MAEALLGGVIAGVITAVVFPFALVFSFYLRRIATEWWLGRRPRG